VGLRGALVLVAVPLAVACGGAGKSSTISTTKAPFNALIGAGVDLLRQGNPSAAQQLFEQAVAREPSNPVGHYDLGVVLQGSGDRQQALRQYRLAVADDPQYTPALFNEAVMIASRDAPLAIFYYHRILTAHPASPTALLNLGLLEAATRYPRRFFAPELRKAVALDPALRSEIPAKLRGDLSDSPSTSR
jgi:Tfp pilus assembly protein PilF